MCKMRSKYPGRKIRNISVIAYLAGIIDGEGSIYIYEKINKGKYIRRYAGIQVSSTDPKLIAWLQEKFPGTTYTQMPPYPHQWKESYTWRLTKAKEVYLLLKKLLPYLIIKKEKALEILAKLQTFRFYQARGEFGRRRETSIPSQALLEEREGVEVSPEIMDISAPPEYIREDMTRATQEWVEVRERCPNDNITGPSARRTG
jgi:hypothetical protein